MDLDEFIRKLRAMMFEIMFNKGFITDFEKFLKVENQM